MHRRRTLAIPKAHPGAAIKTSLGSSPGHRPFRQSSRNGRLRRVDDVATPSDGGICIKAQKADVSIDAGSRLSDLRYFAPGGLGSAFWQDFYGPNRLPRGQLGSNGAMIDYSKSVSSYRPKPLSRLVDALDLGLGLSGNACRGTYNDQDSLKASVIFECTESAPNGMRRRPMNAVLAE